MKLKDIHHKRIAAAAAALVFALAAAGCSGKKDGNDTSSAASDISISDIPEEALEIEAEDKDVGFDESSSTSIAFSGGSAEISGDGAELSDGVLSITEEGTYILSGSFDGQINVNSKGSKIKLVLDGVSVSNPTHSALLVQKAKKVTLTLNEGTKNSFSDGAEYTLADSEDNADGAVFSKADLVINGEGSLEVTGNYKHAIVGKDTVTITGGNISVTAASGGIYGKDCVKISGGDISVEAGSNGIRSTNDESAELGFVAISGGTINVNAAGDGIEAESVLKIEDGDISISTGGGSENASVSRDGTPNGDWGKWNKEDMGGGFGRGERGDGNMQMPDGDMQFPDGDMQPPDGEEMQKPDRGDMQKPDGGDMTPPDMGDGGFTPAAYIETNAEIEQLSAESSDSGETSAKGLKAGSAIEISGGTINVDSSDDSIHSNGSAAISDGVISALSGDDGIHADAELYISGGTIDIGKSYEGIEGLNIYVSGGEISVTASDDGFNAAGGSDTGMENRPGRNGFAENADSSSHLLEISGGNIFVDAGGDGLDSNGDLKVSGGMIIISGPTSGGDGALDYGDFGSTAQITGGTIIAAGAMGMEVGFDESSTQYNVLYDFSSSIQSGEEFSVTDQDGNVLLSYTFNKSYQSVVFSCPELAEGTYTVSAGGISEEITISSICTSNSSGGFGGGGGMHGGGGDFGGGKPDDFGGRQF